MPAFESITLSLPAHWIAPVLYGDVSPLDEAEAVAFSRWLEDTIEGVGHGTVPMIGRIEDQTYFARYHDAAEYGVLACDCYDVEFLVPEVGGQVYNMLPPVTLADVPAAKGLLGEEGR